MHLIYDDATLVAALAATLDETSRTLIERIAHDAKASDLWELTCIVVIGDSDSAQDFEEALGFDPALGPLGGEGEPFDPYWSWQERHGGKIELLMTAGDSGFAWFMVMPESWFVAHIGDGG